MSTAMKFWDGSKRRNWFVMREVAQKLAASPELIAEARRWAESNWRNDPSKQRGYRLWTGLLALSPEALSRALLADTPEAQEARESSPPCLYLTGPEMARAIDAARREPAIPP